MRKKISLLLLALVLCFACGLTALGCGGGGDPVTYTVTYVDSLDKTITTKTVNDGETVDLTGVTVEPREGYDVVWKVNGEVYDWNSAVKSDITIKAEYAPKTNTPYKITYYFENLTGGYDVYETVNKTGTTFTSATADPTEITIEGGVFSENNANNIKSAPIKADGSTELKLYFDRQVCTVTYTVDGATFDTASAKYGATVTATEKAVPDKDVTSVNYKKFKYWSATEGGAEYNFTTVLTGDVTLYPVYEEKMVEYVVDLAMASDLYYLLDDNGDYYEDLDVDFGAMHYGDEIKFAFELTEEAFGVKSVKANGETLTPVNGIYTVTVNGDITFEIDIDCKTYAVGGALEMYDNAKVLGWAKIIDDFSDVVIKIGDQYYDGAVNASGGFMVEDLPKGEYVMEFYAYVGEALVPISNDKVEFAVSSAILNGETVLLVDEFPTVGYLAFEASNDDWFINEAGAMTNSSRKGTSADNVEMAFNGLDLTGDFAVTVSYEQSLLESEQSMEGQPTLGFGFTDKEGNAIKFTFVNAGNLSFRYNNMNANGEADKDWYGDNDEYLLCGAGGMLGMSEWPDAYRRVTLTYVKSGAWLHVYYTGDANGQNAVAKAYDNLLIVSIDVENGKVYTKEKMSGKGATLSGTGTYYTYDMAPIKSVFANIDTAIAYFQVSRICYADITAWGYTNDTSVIDSYVKNTYTKFNVTTDEGAEVSYSDAFVDGDNGSKVLSVLGYEKTQSISFKIKEGYVVKTLKVNGKISSATPDANNVVTVEFPKTSTRDNEIAVEMVTINGSYVTISGTVNSSSVAGYENMAKPSIIIYNDETSYEVAVDPSGNWTAQVLSGTYSVTASASSFYKASVVNNVTATTESAEIVLTERTLGGSATVGNTTYYSGGNATDFNPFPMATVDYKAHAYVVEEVDGKETATSTASTPARQALLFSGFAADKFVVRAKYTYLQVSDRWNIMGFFVVDENGQMGHIGAYGGTTEAVRTMTATSDGWKNFAGNHTVVYTRNGKNELWYNAGHTVEYAMVYDNGNINFFAKDETVYGIGWECLYSGRIPTWGTIVNGTNITWGAELSGPVVVGLVDTQNKGSARWIWSDYSAVAGQQAIDDFLAQRVILSENASAKVTADIGEAQVNWNTEEYRFITLTPKNDGEKIVDVKVNGVSSPYAMYDTATGKANLYLTFDVDVKDLVIDVTTSTNMNDYKHDDANAQELISLDGGIYKSDNKNNLPQETAIKENGNAVTFNPKTQKLVFTYSTSWTGTMTNLDSYDSQMGFFIRSAEGGMFRLGWTRAGDVLRMRTANYRMSGNYVVSGNTDPWTALGNASGYHSTAHPGNVKLYIRVTVDGYVMKIESKTGDGCACKKDWCVVRDNFNVYDEYNNTIACTSMNTEVTYDAGVVNNMFVNDLYSTDLPCTFGISVITEAGVDKIVTFDDISYEIINK